MSPPRAPFPRGLSPSFSRGLSTGMAILLLSCAVLGALLPAAVTPPAPQESVLAEREAEKLGVAISGYFEARREAKDVAKTLKDLEEELARVEKKLKGDSLLAHPEDLGRAFWHSYRYDRAKGVKKGKVAEVDFREEQWLDGVDLGYAIWAPAAYTPATALPLVLVIADEKERPVDHINERWMDPELRESVILVCPKMPEDPSLWTENSKDGKPGGRGILLLTFREVSTQYAIDFDRVFLGGYGQAGVDAAARLAAMMPDRFAGLIGRTGDITSEIRYENFKNLPSYFAGGGSGVTKLVDAVEKAGYANCIHQPEGTEKDILAWIRTTERNGYPERIVFVPQTPSPLRAFWLQVPAFDTEGKALVDAKADRETNTITISGEHVSQVTVYFNDLIVDLSKPVKVVCNGVEHVDLIPRNLQLLLETQFNGGVDPGRVYVASHVYDLPAAAD
jgi:hypothetical protein